MSVLQINSVRLRLGLLGSRCLDEIRQSRDFSGNACEGSRRKEEGNRRIEQGSFETAALRKGDGEGPSGSAYQRRPEWPGSSTSAMISPRLGAARGKHEPGVALQVGS